MKSHRRALLPPSALLFSLVFAQQSFAEPDRTGEQPPIQAVPTPPTPQLTGEPLDLAAVFVTGTRIPRSEAISTAPYFMVTDEEFRLSGTHNVEQLLNSLPQVIPNRTAFLNNSGDGTVDIDLRGLGPTRTLVLVNGRRWMPADESERSDLNTIPTFLIEGVDVVTGGGAAVHGSGAVAGVVNFRLREIEGLIGGANAAITEEGDGRRESAHLGYGAQFGGGRGRASAFAEYLRKESLLSADRAVGRFFWVDDTEGGLLIPGGSSAVPEGRFAEPRSFGADTNYAFPGAIFSSPGVSRPFNPGSASSLGDFYNFQPINYLMVPQQRWVAGGRAQFEISSAAHLYGDLHFTNSRVTQQIAPDSFFSFLSFGSGNIDLAAVAEYLSTADMAQLQLISERQQDEGIVPEGVVMLDVRYRTVQAGPRRYIDDRDSWRALGGITGMLARSLTYDVSYQFAETRNSQSWQGNIADERFNAAIEDGTCNVFGANLLSDACLATIVVPLHNDQTSRMHIAQATIGGPIFALPGSAESVSFVVGTEWHTFRTALMPDESIGEITENRPPLSGRYHTKAIFGELSVPLVRDRLLHRVQLDGGFRYSDYSLGGVGEAWSWFTGAVLAPIPAVTFRGQYQRAFRAPNVRELFGEQFSSFAFPEDPCSFFGQDLSDTVRQLCIATGVPPEAVFGFDLEPFPAIEVLRGGSPELREEKADIWTAGVVLRPRFAPRLTIAVDHYDIQIENVVGPLDPDIEACYYLFQDQDHPSCRAISRDPATGTLLSFDGRLANLAALRTSGVDFLVNYVQPLAFSLAGAGESRVAFHFLGNWTDRHDLLGLPGGGGTVNEFGLGSPNVACAGRFGNGSSGDYRTELLGACGQPKPRWSWTTRLSWLDGPVTTSLRWRHVGAVRDDLDFDALEDSDNYVVERIGDHDLLDLAFSLRMNDDVTIGLGVNNLLDKQPPIVGSNSDFGINTWPGTYDVLGRDFFLSVRLRF
jgi:outer membrane receptor protein involved in Fe transport